MNFSIQIVNKIRGYNEKNKRLLVNALFSFAVKGGALLISFFTLPAYMRFFENREALGLWFTAVSVLSWVLTFDLGIGNGLRNHLVRPLADKDWDAVKMYISSAYVMTGVIVLIILIIGYILFAFLNWNTVFNIPKSVVAPFVLLRVTRLLFIGVMLQFFLRLITSVLFALQKSAIPALLNLLSNAFLLSFVLLAHSGSISTNLIVLASVSIVSANLPLFVVSVILFLTTLRKCLPNINFYSKKYAFKIMTLGGVFFWLQIMAFLIRNTNEFLISWFVNTSAVVNYKIYNSIFNLVGTVFFLALVPVWSEVTEAFATENFMWIKKLYKRLRQLAFVAVLAELALLSILQPLINIWLKDKAILVNYRTALIFAVSGSVLIWHATVSSIVNGIGKLKVSLIFLTFGAIINVPLAYMFTLITGDWVAIVLANIISLLPFCIVQSWWLNRYFKATVR